MSIKSDLTPEEEAMFAAGGQPAPVDDAGSSEAAAPEASDIPAGGQPAPADDAAAPVDGAAPADGRPRMVPHEALHAERMRSAQLAQERAQVVARMNALLSSRQPQPTSEMPNLEENPSEYIRTLEERISNFESQRAEEMHNREIDNAFENDERAFAAYTPDYHDASTYYVQSRAKELLQFHSPQDARAIMEREARQIAASSWQRGMPAAASVYELAKARGYTSRLNAEPAPVVPGVGGAPASAAAVVESVRKGQKPSLSGSGVGGAAAVNAEALLAMSDEEFAKYVGVGTTAADVNFAKIAGR